MRAIRFASSWSFEYRAIPRYTLRSPAPFILNDYTIECHPITGQFFPSRLEPYPPQLPYSFFRPARPYTHTLNSFPVPRVHTLIHSYTP